MVEREEKGKGDHFLKVIGLVFFFLLMFQFLIDFQKVINSIIIILSDIWFRVIIFKISRDPFFEDIFLEMRFLALILSDS
jgi:hypothetical protein